MRTRWPYITALLIILVLTGLNNYNTPLTEFPTGVHAWAQTDHYSLALGFKRNGLNFFKPETYVLNHQFPYNFLRPAKNSITSVDFPIHEYIPAICMRVFNTRSPVFFRLYVILLSIIGLFYLFRLALMITGSKIWAFGLLIWTATIPVFALFQGSFMPSIPSLSLMIIGLYYYFFHIETEQRKPFITAIILLTIAALTRKTFAIPLVAIGAYEILQAFTNKKNAQFYKIKIYVLMLLIFLSYQVYNHYLFYNYGSVFLNYFLPPHNMVEAKKLLRIILDKWSLTFASPFHYVLLLFSLFLIVKHSFSKTTRNTPLQKAVFFLLTLMFIGDLIFFAMMMKQWEHHDYYWNDTFLLPIFLLVSLGLSYVPLSNVEKWKKYAVAIFIVISVIYTAQYALNIKTNRIQMSKQSRIYTTFQNFKGTEAFLDSLGVAKDAKILVMDAYAPNLPFILMNRKGMAILSTTVHNLGEALKWKFNLLALQDTFLLSDIYPNAPNIIHHFKKIASNGKVSFYKRKKETEGGSLETFLGLDSSKRHIYSVENFEQVSDTSYTSEWEYLRVIPDSNNKNNHIMLFKEGEEFGMKWEHPCPEILTQESILFFKGRFMASNPNKIKIVAHYGRFDTNETIYKDESIEQQLYPYNKWRYIALKIPLKPHNVKEDCTLKVFIWNEKKQKLLIDDISFGIYKPEVF